MTATHSAVPEYLSRQSSERCQFWHSSGSPYLQRAEYLSGLMRIRTIRNREPITITGEIYLGGNAKMLGILVKRST